MYVITYYLGKASNNSRPVHRSRKFKKYPRHSDIVQNEPKDYNYAFVERI